MNMNDKPIDPPVSAPEAFSNQDYLALINHAADGFFALDGRGVVVAVNDRLCAIIGRSREEILGASPLAIVAPESMAEVERQLAAVARTDRRAYRVVVLRADGRRVPLLVRAVTRRDADGLAIGALTFVTDLSGVEDAQQVSAQTTAELHGVLDNMQDTYYRTDAEGKLLRASRSVEALLGYRPEEVLGRKLADYYYVPQERELFLAALAAQGGAVRHFESRLRHRDGREVLVSTNAQYWRHADGRVGGVEGFARCFDDVKQARDELRLSAEVLNHAADAVVVADGSMRVTKVNPAFTQLTGRSEQAAAGMSLTELLSDADGEPVVLATRCGQHLRREVSCQRADGSRFPAQLTLSTLCDEHHRPIHHVAMLTDITERKAATARIEHLAHHDSLTDLPNRLLFRDRVERAIAQSQRCRTRVAMLFVDLDHFKAVNDTRGHAIGDVVLQQVSRRLLRGVRACDTVSRHGGDEFLVALTQIDDASAIEDIAAHLQRAVAEPIDVDGERLYVNCTVGAAAYPDHGTDCDELLRAADEAMYQAKRQRRGSFSWAPIDLQVGSALPARGDRCDIDLSEFS
jgi:diguanylate cyclase (GGDEF)-like protein/PAS domain S-box-containing protein